MHDSSTLHTFFTANIQLHVVCFPSVNHLPQAKCERADYHPLHSPASVLHLQTLWLHNSPVQGRHGVPRSCQQGTGLLFSTWLWVWGTRQPGWLLPWCDHSKWRGCSEELGRTSILAKQLTRCMGTLSLCLMSHALVHRYMNIHAWR